MNIVSEADHVWFSSKVPWLEIAMLALSLEVSFFLQILSSAIAPSAQKYA